MPPKPVKLRLTKNLVNPIGAKRFPDDSLTPEFSNPRVSDVWSDVKKEVDHVIIEDDIEEDPDWVEPFQPCTSREKSRPTKPVDPDLPLTTTST